MALRKKPVFPAVRAFVQRYQLHHAGRLGGTGFGEPLMVYAVWNVFQTARHDEDKVLHLHGEKDTGKARDCCPMVKYDHEIHLHGCAA